MSARDGAQPRSEAVVQRLRLKIVTITMGALLAVIIAMLAVLNVFMQMTSRVQTERLLTSLVENRDMIRAMPERGFSLPSHLSNGSPPQMLQRAMFFTASFDEGGTITAVNIQNIMDLSEEEAISLVQRAYESGRDEGAVGAMQYTIVPDGDGFFAAFVEQSMQYQLLTQLRRISIFVASISGVLLLALTIILSIWITRPIQQSLQQQKAFISDASHEIKTPLTIIAANADALAKKQGQSKWLTTIQGQTEKLSGLVHDLLLLARASEAKLPVQMERIDLHQTALDASLAFESPMFEAGKVFTMDIEEAVWIYGNADDIEQLIGILLDNAMKYSDARGAVHIALKRHGGRAQLSVFNTGAGLAKEEMPKVFRRFYRSDASRSRQAGGYGLGLSIAQAIVQQHQGKIAIAGEEGKGITFSVAFKVALK